MRLVLRVAQGFEALGRAGLWCTLAAHERGGRASAGEKVHGTCAEARIHLRRPRDMRVTPGAYSHAVEGTVMRLREGRELGLEDT